MFVPLLVDFMVERSRRRWAQNLQITPIDFGVAHLNLSIDLRRDYFDDGFIFLFGH